MTIVILGLVYGLPILIGIAMQGLTMRYLAPVTGIEKPEFMDTAGIATRQVVSALFLILLLHWLPIFVSGPLVVVGAFTITVLHCQNVYEISLQHSVLYVLITTLTAIIGVLLLGVLVVIGAKMIHTILLYVAGASAIAQAG